MKATWIHVFLIGVLGATLALAGCGSGADGSPGPAGPEGPAGPPGPEGAPGGTVIDATLVTPEYLEGVDVMSEITGVMVASPPVVNFTVTSAAGVPITGIGAFWAADHRFVRFTITKLVPGTDGDPDSWVAYIRSGTGTPTYDSGASLVDHGDGTYTFTFNTDVTTVAGIPWEPTLTHRVAGQIGSGSVALEAQNLIYDYVPAGGPVVLNRNIAIEDSCNECHDRLSIHGRRFKIGYCVQCHNPDLAGGEGNLSWLVHRIHSASNDDLMNDGMALGEDWSEVTYPQDVLNCRKCHDGADPETPQGDNWKNLPHMEACDGCHGVFSDPTKSHTGGPQSTNFGCSICHSATAIETYHTTPNATPHNPSLLAGQRNITYELLDASVDGANQVIVNFRILSDGTPLDVTNLPADLATPNRYPGLLLAYALPQDGIMTPADYNNMGRASAQPISLGLNTFSPITGGTPNGTITFSGGVNTATVTLAASQFPVGATLRAVGLQGYFQQSLGGSTVSLHTPSKVVPVTGDAVRRSVVDSAKCSNCHEWFEGHGGNRVYEIAICTLCHVPNLSSSGRTLSLAHPEDTQNLKDMIHGIHSSDFRTRAFEHVRNFSGSARIYDWSEVTFPAEVSNCLLCHKPGTYELPLAANLLPTNVRTTGVADGMDASTAAVNTARGGAALPGSLNWVNTPTASSCFYCHTSADAMAHMMQNGALLSVPDVGPLTWRSDFGTTYESCTVCHGEGKVADVSVVHGE